MCSDYLHLTASFLLLRPTTKPPDYEPALVEINKDEQLFYFASKRRRRSRHPDGSVRARHSAPLSTSVSAFA